MTRRNPVYRLIDAHGAWADYSWPEVRALTDSRVVDGTVHSRLSKSNSLARVTCAPVALGKRGRGFKFGRKQP